MASLSDVGTIGVALIVSIASLPAAVVVEEALSAVAVLRAVSTALILPSLDASRRVSRSLSVSKVAGGSGSAPTALSRVVIDAGIAVSVQVASSTGVVLPSSSAKTAVGKGIALVCGTAISTTVGQTAAAVRKLEASLRAILSICRADEKENGHAKKQRRSHHFFFFFSI